MGNFAENLNLGNRVRPPPLRHAKSTAGYAPCTRGAHSITSFFQFDHEWHISSHFRSDQGTFTPVGAQGGGPRDPSVENHFPSRISQWNLHHICMDYKKSQFWKKKWKCCTVSKWRPNNRFLFRVISILAKIWKTTFPKEFFNEI